MSGRLENSYIHVSISIYIYIYVYLYATSSDQTNISTSLRLGLTLADALANAFGIKAVLSIFDLRSIKCMLAFAAVNLFRWPLISLPVPLSSCLRRL